MLALLLALPASAAPPKLVLCWYMVCFGNSVEGYKQEIELAQRHGIDGFLLDVGAWQTGTPGQLKPTNYVTSAERMFEAARQLGTGFQLAMAPEYSAQPFVENVRDMVLRFKDHPNQLRHGGKPVLSGYANGSLFPPAVDALKAAGVEVCLVPDFHLPRWVYNPSAETVAEQYALYPCLDGQMVFNTEQLGNNLSRNAVGRRVTQRLGKLFAAGVVPAYNSANLQDYRGLSGYLSMWQGAVDDGADWISIVIWNDYNEDSALMPGRWPFGSERYLYDRDESFLDATAYASAWFKSGQRPTITQDKLFVTYRNRSKWLRQVWDGQRWGDVSLLSGRFDQLHDDVEDLVYVDTFLTAPASLTVDLGPAPRRFELPAGVGHVEVPLVPGVPRLTLARGGQTLADVVGRQQIIAQPTSHNSLVGYHAVFRTWASGTAIGPVAHRLTAAEGTLTGGATLVDGAAQNTEAKDSGVTWPVAGLATATYNVRLTYCNPSAEQARLTLYADGPPRATGDYPYFIPACLPPTGAGVFRTVSFFWSLYDTTRTLKLQWQPSFEWGQPRPADNDYGVVRVAALELVKVEPVTPAAPRERRWPELVPLPGGSFTMGSDTGEPDERPRHQVRLSSFALGRYEVTNEEFERFDPAHRAFRDGNSWRDREPVVHISWTDAARYCNWLSREQGLAPAYDEKTWALDPRAEGFRLPTEAEWEYAATGRGEGRAYPWGDAPPVPELHGHFALRAALGARLPRPSTEGGGAVVVGSYPAGASRDGVYDLAGNVGEWCSDWYGYYTGADQTDPCCQTPGNFRVIRGGSWSWYGHSQRATDREFNSAGYPGHAYYGCRVALSAAGWAKLQARPAGR